MRPSQKASEERKWVIDAVNKYFDVIVEEEEEDEEEDEDIHVASDEESEDEDIESLSDIEYQDSDEEMDESESEEEDEGNVDNAARGEFRSTAKIRGLLSTALTKMSSSRSDLSEMNHLPNDEKQSLLKNLKQKLGSQISLKRRSQDFLNAI